MSPGGVSPIRSDVPISSSSSTISSSSSGRVSPFKPLPTSGLPTLKICGVPEHFNLPWTLGMKKGVFDGVVDVLWTPMPGGTGAMVSAVADGTVDVAVALTEGIVAAVLASNSSPVPLRYAGSYVASPLRWMIVAACDCEGAPRELEELRVRALQGGTIRVSVSRLGSGSHLMAYLLALREGWPLSSLVFTEDKNFRSMRKGEGGVAFARPSSFFSSLFSFFLSFFPTPSSPPPPPSHLLPFTCPFPPPLLSPLSPE